MSLPVVLRPEARQEYDAAADFYEAQRAGRGGRFAARVNEVLARIGRAPRMHAAIEAMSAKRSSQSFRTACTTANSRIVSK